MSQQSEAEECPQLFTESQQRSLAYFDVRAATLQRLGVIRFEQRALPAVSVLLPLQYVYIKDADRLCVVLQIIATGPHYSQWLMTNHSSGFLFLFRPRVSLTVFHRLQTVLQHLSAMSD